ncbi:MAG: hypothetical protein U9Q66_03700 [Patescibacteria group bacterium]|nr:hypothetical protein [Patescibacteria group bacterium]
MKTKFVELGRGIDIDFINNLKFYIDVNGKLNLWTLMPNNKHSESSVITLVNS